MSEKFIPVELNPRLLPTCQTRGVSPKIRRGLHGQALGSARRVYFDDSQSSLLTTAAEAATLAAENFSEVIFSLEPGKLAIVFSTHQGAYLCRHRRPNA